MVRRQDSQNILTFVIFFPAVDDDDLELEPENLSTNFDEFVNYAGVEDNPAANEALQGYISKGYLHVCETLEECRTFLKGEEPVVNKLGCIVKEKTTPEGDVVTKTRIILDAKQSKVTAATQRKYRSILPRLTDAVADALALASDCKPGEVIEQLIADVSDAFWLIPLAPVERKFFVAQFRGKYLVFLRTAQGSRTAPLTFCAIGGCITIGSISSCQ